MLLILHIKQIRSYHFPIFLWQIYCIPIGSDILQTNLKYEDMDKLDEAFFFFSSCNFIIPQLVVHVRLIIIFMCVNYHHIFFKVSTKCKWLAYLSNLLFWVTQLQSNLKRKAIFWFKKKSSVAVTLLKHHIFSSLF